MKILKDIGRVIVACANPHTGHVQVIGWHEYKKARVAVLLLVPIFRRLALPFPLERATQKPTLICIYHIPCLYDKARKDNQIHIPNGHLPLLCSEWDFQVCETSKTSDTKRQVNAFHICASLPPRFCYTYSYIKEGMKDSANIRINILPTKLKGIKKQFWLISRHITLRKFEIIQVLKVTVVQIFPNA